MRTAVKNKLVPKQQKLTDEEKEGLRECLDSADISYMNPGRKVNIYIGKMDGKKQYVKKR